jgi:NAD(P)-dependent dehydrogenase (short-subunit alcohol dehydrogenase family)
MDHTRITTPFGAESTAADVIAGVDLRGKRASVTGGASGIGLETARALASAGAEVTLAVRNIEGGQRAAADLSASTGNQQVLVAPLDLADQLSIVAFVANWKGPLHILVDNAGIMASPEMRTPEGWELQFATNHLGHFALTTGLHDALAAAGGARVVVVSSVGHLNGEVLFDDIHFERHPYDPWKAYSQSKTANVLFTVEAAMRWAADGITVNALTPGRIRTNLMRFIGNEQNSNAPASFEATSTAIQWKTVEQGAATSVLLAASPLVAGVTGRYFADCNEAEPQEPGIRRGVAAYAVDPEKAARLWQISVDTLARARRQ